MFRTFEEYTQITQIASLQFPNRYITGMGIRNIMLRKNEGKNEDLTREGGKKEKRKARTSRKD
jgi:hypothetical protein